MTGTRLTELRDFGQSIWLDNISSKLIKSGELKKLAGEGLCGLTSNPTIFEKAIASSSDYDRAVESLAASGKDTFGIYDELTAGDIREAADIFRPVYESSKGLDGYVSLEIDPRIAGDTRATIQEGERLYKKVDRPNLMLKVPATAEGFPAVEHLIGKGMNVNVTLIFSLEQYAKTAEAYLRGLSAFSSSGGDLSKVSSVASVFVSRIDTAVDQILDEKAAGPGSSLKAKSAVANCAMIYERYSAICSKEPFTGLKNKGARPQRVLWASTSTKNPALSDVKYVTELIAKNTVNTLPGNTLAAFMDHGAVKEALSADAGGAAAVIKELSSLGIDINKVCAGLLEKGLSAFVKSFESLMEAIDGKALALSGAARRGK